MLEFFEFYGYANASRFRYRSSVWFNVRDKYHARDKNACENRRFLPN